MPRSEILDRMDCLDSQFRMLLELKPTMNQFKNKLTDQAE